MSETTVVTSLSELAERLFAKPPALQLISPESASGYVNAAVSSVGEGMVGQLLASEHCTSASDQKLFNDHVSTGTLLHLLAFVGRQDATEWLLKNGAYVHYRNHDGSTPLHVAALRHHSEIINLLRYYHADVYIQNKDDKTPLDFGQDEDDVKEALLSSRFSTETIEDEFLQDRLPSLIEKVLSPKDPEEQLQGLMCLRAEIRMATSSMTSVPKPLKQLQDHLPSLVECYEKLPTSPPEPRPLLADILSVLAVVQDQAEQRTTLKYRLLGSQEQISSYGHPYIRRLCTQIPEEWNSDPGLATELLPLVRDIAVYCLQHSAEAEACDLLMEIEKMDMIVELVSEDIHDRVCLYLISCVKYVPEPEDSILQHTALKIYRQFHQFPHALRVAMMLNDPALIKEVFLQCPDSMVRKQLAFMLGRQQMFVELEEGQCPDVEDLSDIMSNVHLNNNFLALARELDIMEPKVPEDIYKTHLEHARFSTAAAVDSARANLAASFVNGFVNCGFGEDKLLTEDGNRWIYKNKGHGMLSATGSLGLILLWDVEGGLTQIDKFLYSNEDQIKAGALLACGIVNTGVRNECDPALALLSDYVLHSSSTMRLGAVVGLGLAYAGSAREDVIEVLTPVMEDSNSSFEVVCLGALSCALVAVGTCHGDLSETFLQLILEKEADELNKTTSRYLALALALLYLGKQEAAMATTEALKAVPQPFSSFASILLEICAYAGTGNVLKIQSLLHTCSEFHSSDKKGEEGGEEEGGGTVGEKPAAEAASGSKEQAAATGDEGEEKSEEKPKEKPKEKAKEKKEAKSGVKKDDKVAPEPGSIAEPGSHQAVAVLGIALIAMGEDIGAEMSLRSFNHLLRYGDPVIRRAVPLALALLSASNPQLPIVDTLSKFSHDSDPTVARNAIFAMGVVGSGTNNSRLAGLLRNLAQFYHKEPQDLFMVRLAQGLTHLGKGTLTLNPFHSDRTLLTPVAVAGLMAVLTSMLDASNTILKDAHYMLYYLTPAIQPRMLVTFDEDLSPLSTTVRVGQAVDVVGQAGKPKTITGFQTHTTPVLLAYGERAELANEEYSPLTPVMEGFVICRKNPDYHE